MRHPGLGRPAAILATVLATMLTILAVNPSTANAAEWPVVQEGDQGPAVQTVQHLLRHSGSDIEADGDFGPLTDTAVRDFQAANGLGVDGIVGGETWPVLAVDLAEGNTGEVVIALQLQLGRYGYDVPTDGGYDAPTTDSVVDFKTQHGLPADTVVDDATWLELVGGAGDPGGYALPLPQDALPRSEYDDPHHNYPAIDLPVPEGTEAYAVTSGDAVVFTDSSCGNGVQLAGSDGATYVYCHFSQHSIGDGPVEPGQLIGLTGTTGNSTGPHLHFQIRTSDDALRCPQEMLLAIYDGAAPPAPTDLPTSGCSYTSGRAAIPLDLATPLR